MGEKSFPKELEDIGFEAGQNAIREAVLEAGGFDGVFRELRENWDDACNKYEMLLLASTTHTQREENRGSFRGEMGESILPETVYSVAERNSIPREDAPAFFLAAIVTHKAGLMEA